MFQYRLGRRQRRLTIGAASALSASAARATAVTLYAKVKLGEDPASEKDKAIAAQTETFAAALKPYLARQRQRLRPRSLVEIARHLEVHAKSLHRLPLAAIGRRDIARLIARVSETSGPVAANRTVASVSAFLAYCVRDGLVDGNVAAFVNKLPEASRSRVLSDAELRAIWEATGGGDRYSAIVRLLMLTGRRREEVGGLRWSEIDFDRATIALPPSRTKNARPHEIPLSPAALAILRARPRREGRDYVFGTRHGFNGWAGGKAALDRRAQIAPAWVLHDIRRSVSTVMHERLNIAPHVVEVVLGHAGGHKAGVAGVYNKATYAAEKATALACWAEYVLAVVEGRDSKVVALVRA